MRGVFALDDFSEFWRHLIPARSADSHVSNDGDVWNYLKHIGVNTESWDQNLATQTSGHHKRYGPGMGRNYP